MEWSGGFPAALHFGRHSLHSVLRCGTDCFTQQTTNVCRIRFKTKTQRSRVSRVPLTEKLHFILSTHFITSSVFKVEALKKQSCFFSLGFRGEMMCLPTNPESFCSFIIIQSKFAAEKWQYLSELSIPKKLNVFIWLDHPSFNLLKLISWCKHRCVLGGNFCLLDVSEFGGRLKAIKSNP